MALYDIGMKSNNLPHYNCPPLNRLVFRRAEQYLLVSCPKTDTHTSRSPRLSYTGALSLGNLLVTLRLTRVSREGRCRWARRTNKDQCMLKRGTSEWQHPNRMFLKWPRYNLAKQSQYTFLTRAT